MMMVIMMMVVVVMAMVMVMVMAMAISQISLFLLDKRLKPSVNLTVLFYCRHI